MTKGRRVRAWLNVLRRWPVHPQWFIFRREEEQLRKIAAMTTGLILDIGAGRQTIKNYLPSDASYISLDYMETAVGWYHSKPMIFGDAQRLPIASGKIDTVLLLDVLEHLPRPMDALREIQRILRPKGKLILQVPFLYPPHDEPYDFQRWTLHGLRHIASENGFEVIEETLIGRPGETAALLTNLALAHSGLRWMSRKSPRILLLPLLPPLILLSNLCGWMAGRIDGHDGWMAHGCRIVLEKSE